MNWYRFVMDPEDNPLRMLPKPQRFQVMATLSIMWTTFFSMAAGSWYWYGEIVLAHLLVAAGIVFTSATFEIARGAVAHRNRPRAAGAVRYDDVRGA